MGARRARSRFAPHRASRGPRVRRRQGVVAPFFDLARNGAGGSRKARRSPSSPAEHACGRETKRLGGVEACAPCHARQKRPRGALRDFNDRYRVRLLDEKPVLLADGQIGTKCSSTVRSFRARYAAGVVCSVATNRTRALCVDQATHCAGGATAPPRTTRRGTTFIRPTPRAASACSATCRRARTWESTSAGIIGWVCRDPTCRGNSTCRMLARPLAIKTSASTRVAPGTTGRKQRLKRTLENNARRPLHGPSTPRDMCASAVRTNCSKSSATSHSRRSHARRLCWSSATRSTICSPSRRCRRRRKTPRRSLRRREWTRSGPRGRDRPSPLVG